MVPVEPVVLVGRVAPLGRDGPASGIDKRPVDGPWRIGSMGIEGDEQGDLRYHGGPDKALHHYPFDHAATWHAEIGHHPLLSSPGAFGENLSTSGWTEGNVHIGDIARFGTALLQVSQGRQPCFKLDLRFGRKGMARAVQQSGRTGWYWRVMEAGSAEVGDRMVPVDRPQPDWPISRLVRLFYIDRFDRDGLASVAELPELAVNWRNVARKRLDCGTIEDWSRRLDGANS